MNALHLHDTIAAIATPNAVGGIGVIRISGPEAKSIADRIFASVSGKKLANMTGYTASYGLIQEEGSKIDDAVALVFTAPQSYTGEDVVEFSCHGGLYILQRVMEALIRAGARPATGGEFTKRAFLNGKLSLTQAESVIDTIQAQSEQAARAALEARTGALYHRVERIRQELLSVSAHLSAWVDYPDEDIEELSEEHIGEVLCRAIADTKQLIGSFHQGKIVREGIATAIVGKPNVGKSTLMNLLAGYQKSIVTDIAGTTRDVVEETVRIGDIILRLADTAGLRETEDAVERIGVDLAHQKLEQADLILAVFDASRSLDASDTALIDKVLASSSPRIAVVNKSDLESKLDIQTIREQFPIVIQISAQNGEGLSELESALKEISGLNQLDTSAGILANGRQLSAAQRGLEQLQQAQDALMVGYTLDAVNVCIDGAIEAFLELSGQSVSEAVVDEVFANFCVGK